ncbi:hypothetical protein [Nonomuraea dietziae]|uniref:hypothetical protein n=1 Tax=Nonomuraea dietziae TaxID=65515 RepID=UPI0031D6C006
MKYLKWWTTTQAQEKWSSARGDVSANPKVTIKSEVLGRSPRTRAAGSTGWSTATSRRPLRRS